ncbi:hypothetical protein D3C81_2221970 [compost metagenome]
MDDMVQDGWHGIQQIRLEGEQLLNMLLHRQLEGDGAPLKPKLFENVQGRAGCMARSHVGQSLGASASGD